MATSTEAAVRRKAIIAGVVGNIMEWYDFAVYAYFASVIGLLFFPSDDPVASLLATFAVFAVGFVMRPIGGFVFGHFGDKVGRRATLSAAIILMAAATLMIGLLPSYAQIGILAPILLVVARLLQGFSVGGEWGGAATFLVEYAPPERRGFYGSWTYFGVGAGLLIGSAASTFMTSTLPQDALNSWGWRIPFLFGGLLGLIGLYIRLKIEETPAFKEAQESGDVETSPLIEIARHHYKAILTVIGFTLAWTIAYYVVLVYTPTYLSEVVGLPLSQALFINSIGLVCNILLIPILGIVSDRIGRKPLLLAASIGWVVLTYPLFLLLLTGNFWLVLLSIIIFASLVALFSAPATAALVEMFPTRIRYSALAVPYNLVVAFFGGTTPFIATFLISRTGSDISISWYLIISAVITTIVVLSIKETYRAPLK